MFPDLGPERLRGIRSTAERAFYLACREQLPGRTIVLHSVGLLLRGRSANPEDGEADFVIVDEQSGIVIVEIKGGGVSFDAKLGQWTSLDRTGERHDIKDPIAQARSQKHAILKEIKAQPAWSHTMRGRVLLGHAAFFPDLENTRPLESPDRPSAILGGRNDLNSVTAWLRAVVEYWMGESPSLTPLGRKGALLTCSWVG